ncbi:zinc protease [Cohaesibacter sp. ES.047]|uniref:M16 family metallopeptidase n=1 Tax=Cohaesibacter sp. ES.047 TaxID=1798205 RepID=UPI000BBFB4C5|nr:pitrilysin family protein [Cohaesibacter sp. ES.047]SNY92541.1 zinc protease [Cohaesibacter sp. ES.047]
MIKRHSKLASRPHRTSRAKAAVASRQQAAHRVFIMASLGCLILLLSWSLAQATEVKRVVSDKGVVAWLVEDHTVPIIAMDFSFSGGTAQDPKGKEGTATLLTSLLDEGAGDLDSVAFQTALEENAIKLSFDASKDRFYGSLRTLSPNQDMAFDLLAKSLQSPRFDKAPVERMRATWIAGVKRNERDPNTILAEKFREAAYPGHPYSRPSKGTVESLSDVTIDDIKSMHWAIMSRDDLTIGVVGAIDADTLKGLLDEVFAPLPDSGSLKPIEDVTLARSGSIHVPFDAPQTSIRFAGPGIDRHDKDFYAAYVVNHILGGGSFSSRLHEEIREKRGLAYGVSSYLAGYDHLNLFAGGMQTRADNTEQAVQLVKQEIARLGKEGPTAEELESAKKYLIGNYPLRFDSSSKISRQLVALQDSDLDIDYFDKRNSYIEAITLEDAKRVAKRLLDPSKLLLVTVGQEMKHAEAPKAEPDNDNLVALTGSEKAAGQ